MQTEVNAQEFDLLKQAFQFSTRELNASVNIK